MNSSGKVMVMRSKAQSAITECSILGSGPTSIHNFAFLLGNLFAYTSENDIEIFAMASHFALARKKNSMRLFE